MNAANRDFAERMATLVLATCGLGYLLLMVLQVPGPEGAALAYTIGGVLVAAVVSWIVCSRAGVRRDE
jgi:hypothetical protein